MPTYEYACTSCANEWETEQSIKDDALKECPACHKLTARRQISKGAGFILKGGGWYADLYSSSSNKSSSEGKSEGSGSSEKASSEKASTDAKPASTGSSDTSSSPNTSSEKSSGGDKPAPSGSKPAPAAA